MSERPHNPMLPVLLGRHSLPGRMHSPDRWSAWSASRRAGRARSDERRNRVGMAFLLGRTARIQPVVTRLRRISNVFLSLRPVLLTTRTQVGREAPSARASSATSDQRFGQRGQLVASSPPNRDPRRIESTLAVRTMNSTTVTFAKSMLAVSHGVPESRPLSAVVERVIRTHQRIETHARVNAVIRERSNVAFEVERALTSSASRAAEIPAPELSGGSTWSGGNGFVMPDPSALEQLTDQIVTRIDDRLTAHRERMGRGF